VSSDYTLEDRVFACITIVFLIAVVVFSGYCGSEATARRYKIEAVKRNAAEWVVDQNGDVEFRWNEQAD